MSGCSRSRVPRTATAVEVGGLEAVLGDGGAGLDESGERDVTGDEVKAGGNGRESLTGEDKARRYDGAGVKGATGDGAWEPPNGSLKLSLNYQAVIDAWPTDRRPLLAATEHRHLRSICNNECATMEDEGGEERERRRARVLKYREKRRSRMPSRRTVRYEIRKINAEQRPRSKKGRFVKRNAISEDVGSR